MQYFSNFGLLCFVNGEALLLNLSCISRSFFKWKQGPDQTLNIVQKKIIIFGKTFFSEIICTSCSTCLHVHFTCFCLQSSWVYKFFLNCLGFYWWIPSKFNLVDTECTSWRFDEAASDAKVCSILPEVYEQCGFAQHEVLKS